MSETTTSERWFYAGRRTSSKGKILHAWYDPEREKTAYYTKFNGVIGAAYEVKVERDGDGTTLHGAPRYAEADAAPADLVAGWKAEDSAAYHERERELAEKRADKDDEVQDALDVLRRHFQASKSYSAKWGFAQWVAAEVARPPRDAR